MPTRDGYPEGVPSWADLATTDVDKARAFYSTLFGWDIEDPETEIPYWMAFQKGLPAAGIGQQQEGQPFSVWTTYFAVDDADATMEKIEAAGGTAIMGPDDVADSGRLAVAADPTGAVFGIWQANQHKGAGIVNEHGALNWNELQTNDLDRALNFYVDVFGYSIEETDGASGRYVLFTVGERQIAGAMSTPAEEIPNNWGVYFAVDDLDEALATAKGADAKPSYGPMDIGEVGRIAGISDPTGAHLTLIELAEPMD